MNSTDFTIFERRSGGFGIMNEVTGKPLASRYAVREAAEQEIAMLAAVTPRRFDYKGRVTDE